MPLSGGKGSPRYRISYRLEFLLRYKKGFYTCATLSKLYEMFVNIEINDLNKYTVS